jgi:endonuclease/exonuclease/phosphatase family metal-dependent hydrolase
MPNATDIPPSDVLQEVLALRQTVRTVVPPKKLGINLLIATWNIRAFGNITRKWQSEPGDTPRRDLHSVLCIAEIIRQFDVVAVQEVKDNLRGLRDVMHLLGNDWGLILTDVNRGAVGNGERMAYLFDTRRVQLSGLACELVLPPEILDEVAPDALNKQFVRTPYAVGFRTGNTTFVLVTLHILYGNKASERIPELRAIARWLADWARRVNAYEQNLIALGDFNIEVRGDLLEKTFVSEGLHIPEGLIRHARSVFDETKYYDHIAWFDGAHGIPQLSLRFLQGGIVDFVGHALNDRQLTLQQISWMLSDHYPLWAEFELPQD